VNARTPAGKTKSQGWEIGVSRTLPVPASRAWALVMAALGLPRAIVQARREVEPGKVLNTKDKTQVEIRSYEPGSLLRMRWQPADWDFASTLQIRVRPAVTGTTISVHHEKLENGEQRAAMHARWTALLEDVRAAAARKRR
jgi:uncharacterized protein YndB with AHSA1/START domain